jgi:hypothetical protein
MTFVDEAQATTDTTFEMLGAPAIYYARIGTEPEIFAPALAITVLPTTRDGVVSGYTETTLISAERIFEIRVSEVAAPARNDRLVFGGITYRILEDPIRRDKRALKWTVGCKKERLA